MSRLTKCFALCLGGLTAACTSEATGPTAPASPMAAVLTPAALTAGPKLALSDSLIGFCYRPGTTRNCVFLSERVRITSTVRSLHWRAATDVPWLVLSATTGTTTAGLKISVDLTRVPQPHGDRVWGGVTVRSAGASNSPLRIPVTLFFIPIRY
jgi:hypothetical protein